MMQSHHSSSANAARGSVFAILLSLLLGPLTLPPAPAFAADAANINDVARFLAGLPPAPESQLASLTSSSSWQSHARHFNSAWADLDTRRLSKMRAWSGQSLQKTESTLFYMFSGPDYLYANAFFPRATTYVLSGLEPVGQVPDLTRLSAGELAREIREMENELNSVFSFSFFRTKAMKTQLRSGQIRGTLPLLLVFIARAGMTIDDVGYVGADQDGNLQPVATAPAKEGPGGIKIGFTDSDGHKRTLYYFMTDLSNSGARSSGFLKFCATLGAGDAFVKSASYLMHSDDFSVVRDFLIQHSSTLLQDDSGIPVRYLSSGWDLHPYGAYLGPIGLFGGKGQSDLSKVFHKNTVQPLDFGVGYRYHPRESNLLVAVKNGESIATADPGKAEAEPAKHAASGDDGETKSKSKPSKIKTASNSKPAADKEPAAKEPKATVRRHAPKKPGLFFGFF